MPGRKPQISEKRWRKAKQLYVSGAGSLKEVAKLTGISYTQICRISRADEWVKAREEYDSRVGAQGLEKSAAKDAEALADLLTATKAMNSRLAEMLTDPETAALVLSSGRDAQGIANAISTMDKQTRNIFNIMGELERTRLELEQAKLEAEKARLELEKAKLAQMQADQNEDRTVRVVLSDELKEWSE